MPILSSRKGSVASTFSEAKRMSAPQSSRDVNSFDIFSGRELLREGKSLGHLFGKKSLISLS